MNEIIEKLITVKNQELDNIDLSRFLPYINKSEHNSKYFLMNSGSEHYRLLAYVSSLYNGARLLDVGTNLGFSALALSFNGENKVVSYDIIRQPLLDEYESSDIATNVEFRIGNFLEEEDLNEVPFIFLDTAHDGVFEKIVIEKLQEIKWNGILGMDDIFEYKPLTDIWKNVKLSKYNLTSKGHCTGTGFIIFE